jgi:hypothetical protein
MPKVPSLHDRFPVLDIEADGGLGPSTIDEAAKVCLSACLSVRVNVYYDAPHFATAFPLWTSRLRECAVPVVCA